MWREDMFSKSAKTDNINLISKDFEILLDFLSENRKNFPKTDFLEIQRYYFSLFVLQNFAITDCDHLRLLFFWNDVFVISLILGVFFSGLFWFDYFFYFNLEIFVSFCNVGTGIALISFIFSRKFFLKKNDYEESTINWSKKDFSFSEKEWLENETQFDLNKRMLGSTYVQKKGTESQYFNNPTSLSKKNSSKKTSYAKLFKFAQTNQNFRLLLTNEGFDLLVPYLQLYLLDLLELSLIGRVKQVFFTSLILKNIIYLGLFFNLLFLTFLVADFGYYFIL